MIKAAKATICSALILFVVVSCAPASTSTNQLTDQNGVHRDSLLAEPLRDGTAIKGGSRLHHKQSYHRMGSKIAMSSWLPEWWSSDLNHWQEFPTNEYDNSFPYHGQDKEDQYAHDVFFYNKKHGTYLEMGGLDGLTYTNTLYLNKALGWRGMLIEASPKQYPQMINNRKDDIGLLVAACGTYQDVHWIDDEAVGGILEFMSDGFKEQWHPNVDTSSLDIVPCMPLSAILSKFGVHHLDFWSLDVEGGEMQVLETFDFDAVTINVICIEADGHSYAKDEAIKSFLQAKGYLYHGHVERNDWFMHPEFQPSKNPFSKT